MKPKPLPSNSSASWLRRNNSGATTAAAKLVRWIRYYAVVLLLFATLILWFTPPATTTTATTEGNKESSEHRSSSLPAGTVVVECKFSTPHSRLPNPPGGSFRIAIRETDARRERSSARAFLDLVEAGFYDSNYTFRVIRGFVVQWGVRSDKDKPISSEPAKTRIIESDTEAVPEASSANDDESVEEDSTGTAADRMGLLRRKSNRRGTITMIAGGTGQVFVNLGNNRRLDKERTIPFGVILEDDNNNDHGSSGMRLMDRIYYEYKGGQGQIPALQKGEIATKFPEMGRIDECHRLE